MVHVPHPTDRIHASISDLLLGKHIYLGITGSVAAMMSPMIARELIRHSAEVTPVFSSEGLNMIGEDLMWWATGKKPIVKITGDLEHIRAAGVMQHPIDLFLIAPCTVNTLNKIANGIADTPVTLIAASILGKGIPLVLAYVGHEDLVNNPITTESIQRLEKHGVHFLHPHKIEGKAKIPTVQEITDTIIYLLSNKPLKGKKVLITSGPTRQYIDDVRFITNASSGITGIALAKQAWYQGADVHLILGPTQHSPPPQIKTTRVNTNQEMISAVMNELQANSIDILFLAAAMSDFKPSRKVQGKRSSKQGFTLEFEPAEKLIDKVREKAPKSIIVIYKAEWSVSPDELIQRSFTRLKEANADFVVANDLSEPDAGFSTVTNHVYVIDKQGKTFEFKGTKEEIARHLLSQIQMLFQETR